MQNTKKMKKNDILKFQQDCYKNYLIDIQESIPEFPKEYLFPDGNPILPILPVKTSRKQLMFVGAFPSARFENRNGLLIPIANNLSPFGKEDYFDGQQTRKQASREVLEKDYFSNLGINLDDHWITDLVKIYLMPEKHIKNCIQINNSISYADTHKQFKKIAKASLEWFYKEINVCEPKLIITFGEIVARTIIGDFKTANKELLNGDIYSTIINGKNYNMCHLPHPEIVRRDKKWREKNDRIIETIKPQIKEFIN